MMMLLLLVVVVMVLLLVPVGSAQAVEAGVSIGGPVVTVHHGAGRGIRNDAEHWRLTIVVCCGYFLFFFVFGC